MLFLLLLCSHCFNLDETRKKVSWNKIHRSFISWEGMQQSCPGGYCRHVGLLRLRLLRRQELGNLSHWIQALIRLILGQAITTSLVSLPGEVSLGLNPTLGTQAQSHASAGAAAQVEVQEKSGVGGVILSAAWLHPSWL